MKIAVLFTTIVAIANAHRAEAATVTDTIAVTDAPPQLLRYNSRIAATRRDAARAAMRDAITAYNTLFAINNVEVLMELSDAAPSGGTFALAGYTAVPGRAANVGCIVRLFRSRETSNVQALKFTIAHELAHCYQFAVRSDLRTAEGPRRATADPNAWWVEGSAEFLASTLYAPVGNPITSTIRNFNTLSGRSLFDEDYGQFWFFAFLAKANDTAAVVHLIRTMPLDQAEQKNALNAAPWGPSASLFAKYAGLALKQQLAHQPRLSPERRVVRAFPAIESLQTNPLSIGSYRIAVPAIPRDHGLRVRRGHGGDKGYRIVIDGRDIGDEEVMLCGAPAVRELLVGIGRGTDSDLGASVQLLIDEAPCRPRVTMASLAGSYANVSTSQPFAALVDLAAPRPDDNPPMVAIELGRVPNNMTISSNGEIVAQLSGVQHTPDKFVSFKGAAVTAAFVLGDEVKQDKSAVRLRVRFTTPMQGTASGTGGVIVDRNGTVDFKNALSVPMRWPSFDGVECFNLTVADGKIECGALTFLQGERPRLELHRVGSR